MGNSAPGLDPADWDAFRRDAHAMLDDMISHIETIRSRPVWQPMPPPTRDIFRQDLPVEGQDLGEVLNDVRTHVVPYGVGNQHPRFMGWVHGAGTPVGMVAEMVSAALNMNCGGRDHAGIVVEQQIVQWMAGIFEYPQGASGLFVTGSSMANFLALIVAKVSCVGQQTRAHGLAKTDRHLVAYASAQAHGCIAQAADLSGIGSENLRRIPTDPAGRMDVMKLKAAIIDDREQGFVPFLIVASAGTVNVGSIDPIDAIADVADQERIWLHIDGAIGGLAMLAPTLRPLFKGIERSQSIALDFHKWGHVPYDAGFLLVRDGALHAKTFSSPAAYLERSKRGMATGDVWPSDLGLDLSRGFRALKTWMTIKTFGTAAIGRSILQNCELATYLAQEISQHSHFELKAPVALNIVCFGIKGGGDPSINREIVLDLHENGIAAPSWTTIDGKCVIRCAIVNHRTTRADIDAMLLAAAKRASARLCFGMA